MFKLFRHIAEQMQGAEIYPAISLVIFFLFFLGLIVYVFRMDKKAIESQANIPLDTMESNHFNG